MILVMNWQYDTRSGKEMIELDEDERERQNKPKTWDEIESHIYKSTTNYNDNKTTEKLYPS